MCYQYSRRCYSTNQLAVQISPWTQTGPHHLIPFALFRYAFIRLFLIAVPARVCGAGDTLGLFCEAPAALSAPPERAPQSKQLPHSSPCVPALKQAIVLLLLLLGMSCVKLSWFRPHLEDERFFMTWGFSAFPPPLGFICFRNWKLNGDNLYFFFLHASSS